MKKQQPKSSFVRTGRPKEDKIITCVVYKHPNKKLHYLNTYINFNVDAVLTNRKHTSLIPDDHEIIEIGVGLSFVKKYMKQFKITKITTQD